MPELRTAIPTIVAALRDTFQDALTCAILKGSVYKGDFIPHFSDLDIHAFVRGIGRHRTPTWAQSVAFQRRIGPLDPEAYTVNAFQVSFVDAEIYPEEWVPPWPGTYEVLTGAAPSSFARVDPAAYIHHARHNLSLLPGWAASLSRSFVDKPDRAVPRIVRLLGTYLKGALYDVGIIHTHDPGFVLTSPLTALVSLIAGAIDRGEALQRFYAQAARWGEVRTHPEELREMFAAGMRALDSITRRSVREPE